MSHKLVDSKSMGKFRRVNKSSGKEIILHETCLHG
jgi:hypothetical protein